MGIKQLKIKNIDFYSLIFSGILYLGLGILFLIKKQAIFSAVKGFFNLLTLFFIIAAIFQLIGFTPLDKKKNFSSLSRAIGFLLNLAMAAIIYFKPEIVVSILPIFFGVYALFSGIIRLLIYVQYKRNNVGGRSIIILGAIILIILGILIIVHPLTSILPLSNVIGLFFIFYGISFIMDGLLEGLAKRKYSL